MKDGKPRIKRSGLSFKSEIDRYEGNTRWINIKKQSNMSKFGWSLPPGVSTLPGEEDMQCAVCGQWEDKCVCPECPECGSYGDPSCYTKEGCGLEMTDEQKRLHEEALKEQEEERERENAWAEQMTNECETDTD